MTYEISVHSRRIGDILLRYGDGLLNLSAIERACRCGYLELGEVDLDLVPVLRGLVAARVEYYRRLILAGHRIEPILVSDGPCILDGFHRAQAHREAGRRYASCRMIPAAELVLFMLPEQLGDSRNFACSKGVMQALLVRGLRSWQRRRGGRLRATR